MTQMQTAPTTDDRPAFAVTDRTSLEWYIRTVTAKQQEIATIRAQAEAMVNDLKREIERLEFVYGSQAEAVTRQLLEAARGNARHIKTLWGNIGFRASGPRLEITSIQQSLEWAQIHAPELLRSSLDHRALSARFEVAPDGSSLVDKCDGSVLDIPGVGVRPAQERLYLRTVTGARGLEDGDDTATPEAQP